MEVRVHRLRRVGVLLAQANVGEGGPGSREGLDVAAMHRVDGVLLDHPVQALRPGQRLLGVAAPLADVLGEGVDGECLRVDLLLGVHRRAVRGDAPEHPPMDRVPEGAAEGLVGPICLVAPPVRTQHPARGREGPQDACVEDAPLGRAPDQPVVPVDAPDEPAVLSVDRAVGPVREDVIGQLGASVVGEGVQSVHQERAAKARFFSIRASRCATTAAERSPSGGVWST